MNPLLLPGKKWHGRYPHPEHSRCDFEPETFVVLAEDEAPCESCGEPTRWMDLVDGTMRCSSQCRDESSRELAYSRTFPIRKPYEAGTQFPFEP